MGVVPGNERTAGRSSVSRSRGGGWLRTTDICSYVYSYTAIWEQCVTSLRTTDICSYVYSYTAMWEQCVAS